jgi:hypothetical protein
MRNKPNFLQFSPENQDYVKKQIQFKPKQSQFWPKNQESKAKTKPIQSQSILFYLFGITFIKGGLLIR